FLTILRTPISTLFPYTTLFRSVYMQDVKNKQLLGLIYIIFGCIILFFTIGFLAIRLFFAFCALKLINYGLYLRNRESLQLKTRLDRKSTRLNSSHVAISYAVFC